MKVLLVEDEKLARQNLEKIILSIDPTIEILARLDKVSTTVQWLKNHKADLIFLDIHLADAISFKIFDQVEIDTPIIFTTAFDQYAIQAFKVNSIDYLLKPIEVEEMTRAISKFKNLKMGQPDWSKVKEMMESGASQNYQKRFLVKKGDKLASVKVDDIAFFEGEDRYVYLVKKDGQKYFVDQKLADLDQTLNPEVFFRLNRSFICHGESITDIIAVSKSRVKVHLNPSPSREIIVSTENTRLFKAWLDR